MKWMFVEGRRELDSEEPFYLLNKYPAYVTVTLRDGSGMMSWRPTLVL